MTHMGDQEIGVISGTFPDNPGELACMVMSHQTCLWQPRGGEGGVGLDLKGSLVEVCF